ncbi:MAG: hypothetical protein JOS17DRAFT_777572 [Linnemannia elongata]|nr:MAG: hypothetical protein JOS17DRAFT_777572 [Linnemannia elongata]
MARLTDPKLSPTELALSLPEVLGALGPHIRPSDIESCVLVSRLWSKVFTPWLWYTIDDETPKWNKILMDVSFYCPPRDNDTVVQKKDEKWLRALLKKHGGNIRHLSMTWIALLMNASAEGSTITRLRSLSATRFSMYYRFEEEAALFDLPLLAGMDEYDRPTVEQQQEVISSYIISPAFQDALEPAPRQRLNKFIRGVVASQRFWLLVLQNPDLESLCLGHHLRLNGEAFKREAMIKIMQSLPKLTCLINDIIQRPLQKILGELPGLQHYTYCSPSNDLELDQPFPRLLSFEIQGLGFLQLASLHNLLEFLPSLEQLTINKLQPAPRYLSGLQREESTAGKQESLNNKPHSRLRGFHIVKYDQEITAPLDETIAGLVLPAMPFLAEITLRVLMPATVAALTEHCSHLETVKIVDDIYSSNIEMTLPDNMPLVLLHFCPTLKHLHTARHSVDARLLLKKPIVCHGLETFCCQVVGVDRLTIEEQVLYDAWTSIGQVEQTAMINTTMDTTEEEKHRVVEKYKTSQDLHHQIYATFSELTHLRRLDFGYDLHANSRHRNHWPPLDMVDVPETFLIAGRVYHSQYLPNFHTLELSLDSGLDRLGALTRLKEFGFRGIDHRVGTEELNWMKNAWPRLERVLGVEDDLHLKHFGLGCKQSRKLMEYVKTTLRIKYE